MANIPKTIKITVTSGKKGQPITVRNRNNGEIVVDKNGNPTVLQDTAKAVVDLQNSPSGYTAGHVYDFIVSGEVMGSNSLETSGNKGESITVGTSSITTGVNRGI